MLMTKNDYGYSYIERQRIVSDAEKKIDQKPIRIVYQGVLDQFESNRMNYEYLFWYDKIKIDQDKYKETVVIRDNGNTLSFSVVK
jgi:hypothetical protein